MPRQTDTDVLIAGAGPTGLVLALWLARRGIRVRIIDKAAEAGTTSRALAVQTRTLEFYRQLGIADAVVSHGVRMEAINLWSRGRPVGRAEFGAIGQGTTPFPFALIFPQEQHERLLVEVLERTGVVVERGVELLDFTDRDTGVEARLRDALGRESSCSATYLAGCDGARSVVREQLGTGFPGGTYERIFYVADVVAKGPVANHELHVALDEADFIAVFPLQGNGAIRLVGTVEPGAVAQGRTLEWQDVSKSLLARMQIAVETVHWFSTYHVHHRVASRFRERRVFLLGDAAHIHSPVGGQGMNTGIGDAVNLAWKLADVLDGRAPEALLDSYEPERIAFARRLVATTDRAFTFATRSGPLSRLVRLRIVPVLVPWLLKQRAARRFLFRTISQTLLNYRHSDLNAGHSGDVRGGDRLPWVAPHENGGPDNYEPLTSLDWQVHVYGEGDIAMRQFCDEHGLPLQAFPWRAAMAKAGLRRNAAFLIRPDGYVALAGADLDALAAYLDRHQLSFLRASSPSAAAVP